MQRSGLLSLALLLVATVLSVPKGYSAEEVKNSRVILATAGSKCQIERGKLYQGKIYVVFSEVVACLGGNAYLNRTDGLLDVELPNNRFMVWVWSEPMVWKQNRRFVDLPADPWFWDQSFFYISREALESVLGSGVAIEADPTALPVHFMPLEGFQTDPASRPAEKNGIKIMVDAGHGGQDNGAKDATGILEKDIVLSVALRLARLLDSAGYEVRLTRADDSYPTLSERVQMTNEWDADLMLSLHCNSAPRVGASGVETYVLSRTASDPHALALAQFENAYEASRFNNEDVVGQLLGDVARHAQENASNRLVSVFHKFLIKGLNVEDRGVRKAPFFVLAGTTMPAFLVELGFLSNEEESKLLRDAAYHARLADGVFDGVEAIRRFLEVRKGSQGVEPAAVLPF